MDNEKFDALAKWIEDKHNNVSRKLFYTDERLTQSVWLEGERYALREVWDKIKELTT